MVLPTSIITKFGTLAIVGVIAVLFFQRAFATGSISSAGIDLGSGLTGVGQGVRNVLTGVGEGSSKLLNPFFTLGDLIIKFKEVVSGNFFGVGENKKAVSNNAAAIATLASATKNSELRDAVLEQLDPFGDTTKFKQSTSEEFGGFSSSDARNNALIAEIQKTALLFPDNPAVQAQLERIR